MLGQIDPLHREVTIIGAGAAGLLAAYRLDQLGYKVHLFEAAPRAGGLIRTLKADLGPAETAAHSFQATPPVLELCKDLKIELLPVRETSKSRFILRRGRLGKFPLGPLETLQAATRAYFVLPKGHQDPTTLTMEEWGKRHIGTAATEWLLDPFVRGVYAASVSELGVQAAFPRMIVPPGHSLVSSLLHHRRVSGRKARAKMMVPRFGMGSVTEALARRLHERLGDRFKTGHKLDQLPQSHNCVVSVPSNEAARLLRATDPELALALDSIQYAPLITVTAFVDEPARVMGVGVLNPSRERRKSLGILFNSACFEGRVNSDRHTSYTLMFGGTGDRAALLAPDPTVRLWVEKELKDLLGVTGKLLDLQITRWERAIPIYSPELVHIWEKARAGWCKTQGHVIFSNYSAQVSLRGMIEQLSQFPA